MGARILLVDDEAGIREPLTEFLSRQGYQVWAAATGEAAVEAIHSQAFEVILLDLRIPKIDGLEVMRIAKSELPDSVVILFTGYGSFESAVEALRYGAHDYLLKPASTKDILASIEKGLERQMGRSRPVLADGKPLYSKLSPDEPGEVYQNGVMDSETFVLNGGIFYDSAQRKIWDSHLTVRLTPTENRLLLLLVKNKGIVLPHRELVSRIHGFEATEKEAPEVTRPIVSRLRRKLDQFPGGGSWVCNIRGTGYFFDQFKPAGLQAA